MTVNPLNQNEAIWVSNSHAFSDGELLTRADERSYSMLWALMDKDNIRGRIYAICSSSDHLLTAEIPNGVALADYWRTVTEKELRHMRFHYIRKHTSTVQRHPTPVPSQEEIERASQYV